MHTATPRFLSTLLFAIAGAAASLASAVHAPTTEPPALLACSLLAQFPLAPR